ncbi:hypothetical protein IV203_028102 [Nitzschia inconspicua]|uniref:Membrane-associated protein n=1 Tax=Nitzschia inconspicua TaxID=303405 RepID=A0A9K3M035_9STRA|nr:hypothetical protein IV203_028102 [Nitzschia inconspicua]
MPLLLSFLLFLFLFSSGRRRCRWLEIITKAAPFFLLLSVNVFSTVVLLASASSAVTNSKEDVVLVRGTITRPLNSIQCLVGEWNVHLRGPIWMDASKLLFPPQITNEENNNNNNKNTNYSYSIRRRPWGATLTCTLSIAEDGTFVLSPQYNNNSSSNNNNNHKIGTNSKNQHNNILPIRGEWTLYKNPYCVTDRFYDELALQSYPRIKVTTTSDNDTSSKTTTSSSSSSSQLQVTISLYCRMWGLHDRHRHRKYHHHHNNHNNYRNDKDDDHLVATTSPPSSRPYGRMTHGTVVVQQQRRQRQRNLHTVNDDSFFQSIQRLLRNWNFLDHIRPVVASFSAERRSTYPTHDGWIDRAYFGY